LVPHVFVSEMFRKLSRRLPSAALTDLLKIRCLTVLHPFRKFQLHCFLRSNLLLLGCQGLFWFLQMLPFPLRRPGCLPRGSWKSCPSSGSVGEVFICPVPRLSAPPATIAVLELFLMCLGRYSAQSIVLTVPSSGLPVRAFPLLLSQGFRIPFFLLSLTYSQLVFPFFFFFLFLVSCWSRGLSCLFQRLHSLHLQVRLVGGLKEAFVIREFSQVVSEAQPQDFRGHRQIDFLLQGFPGCSGEVVQGSEFR